MSEPVDFGLLREGRPGCPSDLVLDQHVADELEPARAAQLDAHAVSCAACGQRLAERRRGFDGLDFDARPALARLRAAATQQPRGLWARLRSPRRLGWLWASALVPAAALLLVLRPSPAPRVEATGEPSLGPTGLRMKGALRLRIHRARVGGSEEIESGATVHPGDRLRFVVDLPTDGDIGIYAVSDKGAPALAWPPPDGSVASSEARRTAGPSQLLPGALQIDAHPEPETLHLVLCPAGRGVGGCERSPTGLACPPGCSSVGFRLLETPSP